MGTQCVTSRRETVTSSRVRSDEMSPAHSPQHLSIQQLQCGAREGMLVDFNIDQSETVFEDFSQSGELWEVTWNSTVTIIITLNG